MTCVSTDTSGHAVDKRWTRGGQSVKNFGDFRNAEYDVDSQNAAGRCKKDHLQSQHFCIADLVPNAGFGVVTDRVSLLTCSRYCIFRDWYLIGDLLIA